MLQDRYVRQSPTRRREISPSYEHKIFSIRPVRNSFAFHSIRGIGTLVINHELMLDFLSAVRRKTTLLSFHLNLDIRSTDQLLTVIDATQDGVVGQLADRLDEMIDNWQKAGDEEHRSSLVINTHFAYSLYHEIEHSQRITAKETLNLLPWLTTFNLDMARSIHDSLRNAERPELVEISRTLNSFIEKQSVKKRSDDNTFDDDEDHSSSETVKNHHE